MKKLAYMNELFDTNPYYMELSAYKKVLVKFNFILSRIFKRTALIDYVQYNYFLLNSNGRKRFIDQKKRKIILKKLNNTDKIHIFNNKSLFNKNFSEFIKREWLYMKEASFNEFKDFVLKHKEFLIKPEDGSFGIGIEKCILKNDTDINSIYNNLKNKNIIVEEIIKQNECLKEFNKSSLNTFRIVTVVEDNKVNVFGAVFRIGREGSIVDNHHSGGLSAIIDVDTGIIKTPATDQKFSHYLIHPDSGKKIIGYEVPCWEKIINKAKEAALLYPEVAYVGWDIAVDDKDEAIIIEGNYKADPDVLQRADQVGKWQDFVNLTGIKY